MNSYIKNLDFERIDAENGIVLLEKNMQAIYYLDEIGESVWAQFEEPKDEAKVLQAMKHLYKNVVEQDVFQFIELLLSENIISITNQDKRIEF